MSSAFDPEISSFISGTRAEFNPSLSGIESFSRQDKAVKEAQLSSPQQTGLIKV
jgi:hypothetical protein